MSKELKPCPFCGHPARIEETSVTTDSTRMKIVCIGCGATIDHTQEFATHELRDPVTGCLIDITRVALNKNPIDIWNRRVEDDIFWRGNGMNDIYCPINCLYLNVTEEEQNRIKKDTGNMIHHVCLKYEEPLYHLSEPYKLHKCKQCCEE